MNPDVMDGVPPDSFANMTSLQRSLEQSAMMLRCNKAPDHLPTAGHCDQDCTEFASFEAKGEQSPLWGDSQNEMRQAAD